MFKKFMSKKRNKKRGFTLIELIIVIAIIAILAAIAVPAFGQIREKANVSTDVSNARTIYSVVAAEIADETVTLPTDEDGHTYSLSNIGTNTTIGTDLLSTISNPKAYQSHEFAVWLDSRGNIQIYVVPADFTPAEGEPDEGYKIYPNVTEDSYYDK